MQLGVAPEVVRKKFEGMVREMITDIEAVRVMGDEEEDDIPS